jgi:hypothetical protein
LSGIGGTCGLRKTARILPPKRAPGKRGVARRAGAVYPCRPKRPLRPGRTQTFDMSDTPPDHLAVNPQSPFHDAEVLARGVGIRFNGIERDDVEEYSVSEGWIRVQAGKARDRRGNPMTLKIKGAVEAYFLVAK